jgi:membrane-bound ClpP family serine protease
VSPGPEPAADPVRAKRARISSAVTVASRIGYALFGLAIVLFVVGFATTFSGAVASATVACLVAGCVVLAPSIILGYAVKSAERHDREHGR